MSLTRPEVRHRARDAVLAHARFADFKVSSRWGRNRDETQLPAVDFFTPRFDQTVAGVSMRRDTIDLLALVRRVDGDDLEDLLDADADVLEAAVLGVLDSHFDEAMLVSGENDVPGVGERRVGTMMLTFRLTALVERTL